MHELSITQSMISIILEHAEKNNAKRVLRVNMVVGKMSGVAPHALRFCFETLAQKTIIESASLNLEETPFTGICKECKHSFEITDYACPGCSSRDIETTGGKELYIKEMEIE